MADKRSFASIRKLPSGRYHIRYTGPDGIRRNAPHTFAAKIDAEAWAVAKRQEIDREAHDTVVEQIKQATDVNIAMSARPEQMFDPFGWFVYILWGDDPITPIYIGQSGNILARLGSHMGRQGSVREQTRRVQFIRCPSEVRMAEVEWRLIEHYQPPLNSSSRTARRRPA